MERLYKSFTTSVISKVLIFTDSESEYQTNIIYDKIYNIFLSKYDINDIYSFNTINDLGRLPIENIISKDQFVVNIPIVFDCNNRIICNTSLICKSDVVIIIRNDLLTVLKHRILCIDYYNNIELGYTPKIYKILQKKKNIY